MFRPRTLGGFARREAKAVVVPWRAPGTLRSTRAPGCVAVDTSTSRSDDGTLLVRLEGSWSAEGGIPFADPVIREISKPPAPT